MEAPVIHDSRLAQVGIPSKTSQSPSATAHPTAAVSDYLSRRLPPTVHCSNKTCQRRACSCFVHTHRTLASCRVSPRVVFWLVDQPAGGHGSQPSDVMSHVIVNPSRSIRNDVATAAERPSRTRMSVRHRAGLCDLIEGVDLKSYVTTRIIVS